MDTAKLWEKYYEDKCIETRNDLIVTYYKWAIKLVGTMFSNSKYWYEEDQEDLVSYGIFGLIEAIERYDTSKGASFKTFAFYRIKGSVIDNIRKFHFGANKYRAGIPITSLNDIPPHASDDFGSSIRNVEPELNRIKSHYVGPCEELLNKELKSILTEKIKELPENESKFINLRYFKDRKPKDIMKDVIFSFGKMYLYRKKAFLYLRNNIDEIFING